MSGQVIWLDDGGERPQAPVVQALIRAATQLPPDATLGRRVSIGFDLGASGTYRVIGDNGRVSIDSLASAADCVLTTDEATLGELLRGERTPTTAFMSDKANVRGDVEIATRLVAFLSRVGAPTG
jgi:putative sterol carrier protein